MDSMQLYVFAFLTGLTVAGLTASLCEMVYDEPASFWQLIKSGSRPATMWLFIVTAGPYMLLNDIISARREGRIGSVSVASALATAIIWASATGVVVVDLCWRLSQNLL